MPTVNDYIKDFNRLQKEFSNNIHEYPLLEEMIDEIYDKDIKEINELIEKDDEFYLKKAISKLQSVNNYIKDTSLEIKKLYSEYDKYADEWNKLTVVNIDNRILNKLNDQLQEANKLIKSHNLKDIREANKIMFQLIKDIKYYSKH